MICVIDASSPIANEYDNSVSTIHFDGSNETIQIVEDDNYRNVNIINDSISPNTKHGLSFQLILLNIIELEPVTKQYIKLQKVSQERENTNDQES